MVACKRERDRLAGERERGGLFEPSLHGGLFEPSLHKCDATTLQPQGQEVN